MFLYFDDKMFLHVMEILLKYKLFYEWSFTELIYQDVVQFANKILFFKKSLLDCNNQNVGLPLIMRESFYSI